MTDGNAHIGHTSSTVEFLAQNGRMSELIVVGITNTDRTRDLSPTHVTTTVAGGNSALQFPTSGGADKFLKFIETELIPEIEKRFTACTPIEYWRGIRWAVCSQFMRWSRGPSCLILTWR
jgi:predicted alpha/beta superfamily hydrolase